MLSWMLHRADKSQDSITDSNWKWNLFLLLLLFFKSFSVIGWDGLAALQPIRLTHTHTHEGSVELRCWIVADVELLCWIKSGADFYFHHQSIQTSPPPPLPTPPPHAPCCNQIAVVLLVLDSWGQCLHFHLHQLDGWPENSSRVWGNTLWRLTGKNSALRADRRNVLFSKVTDFRHQTRSRFVLF